jgi:hypothetical protein
VFALDVRTRLSEALDLLSQYDDEVAVQGNPEEGNLVDTGMFSIELASWSDEPP